METKHFVGRLDGGTRVGVAQLCALTAGLVVLNVSLTFTNIWPTLGIRVGSALSVEVALCVFVLVCLRSWWGGLSRIGLRWLAVLWLFLVMGRYTEVTVTSLYGRDINLYWDFQHIPSVGAMFAFVAQPGFKIALVVGFLLLPVALYASAWFALGAIVAALHDGRVRRVVGGVAAGVLLLGFARQLDVQTPEVIQFAEPVSTAYARELSEFAYEASGAGLRDLGPPPAMRSDLSLLDGADVFLIFLESYGAVSWDRSEFARSLEPARVRFESDVAETGRRIVSAFVDSTTFGGESWLAHISLLSGTEVRDQGTNVRLMAQRRDTLVTVFAHQGYRTIALMPGLLVGWPEGAFYGFQEVYNHQRLDYRGPPFGWWDVNDQFALARVDSNEILPRQRPPAFVFFATITTHAPFVPTPPYQQDWDRLLSSTPYDADELDRAWSAWPDWTNLGPSYLDALTYAFANIGGYLKLRADRDLVVILVGDHQPPALVSGVDASWEVPVHVIASRDGILDRLTQRHQFTDGLKPRHPAVSRMDTLLPILLDAFGDTEQSPTRTELP